MDIIFVVFDRNHGGNHLSNLFSNFENFQKRNSDNFYNNLKNNAHVYKEHHTETFLNLIKKTYYDKNLVFSMHYYEFLFLERYFNFQKKYNEVKGSQWPKFDLNKKIEDYEKFIQEELNYIFHDYNKIIDIYKDIMNSNIKIAVISQNFNNQYIYQRQRGRILEKGDSKDSYSAEYKDQYFYNYKNVYYLDPADLFQPFNDNLLNFLNKFNHNYDQKLIKKLHNQWFDMIKNL